jgi:2-dehydro-3-deoxyphosphogluconate aldolase/(4S)-4-hydroxy-2-oxoglutarate aldolase
MDTPGAAQILGSLRLEVPSNALLGAGTVTDIARAQAALAAGASFIVTPNLSLDVIRFAHDHGLPIIPGAMTPTEIFNAAAAGADYVKVFPASALGPSYFRELRGPFAEIPLIATGGVTLENAREFIRFGVDALGIGSSLLPRSNAGFSRCAEIAQEFLQIALEARAAR